MDVLASTVQVYEVYMCVKPILADVVDLGVMTRYACRIERTGERVKMLWWISRWGMLVGSAEADNKWRICIVSPLGGSGRGRSNR